jgi:hypothetical protein
MAKIQTDKQRKLVKLLSENVGLAKPKTMLQMMLEAGYTEETARQQSGILRGVQEELDPSLRSLRPTDSELSIAWRRSSTLPPTAEAGAARLRAGSRAAALDPANFERCVHAVTRRAKALVLVAHT